MASRPELNTGEGATQQHGGGELREELERLGQRAKDAAYGHMDQLRERGMEKARQLEDRIAEEPLKSVLIAAGVGFLLGVMWMRD